MFFFYFKKNIIMYTHEMLYHLFMKYLCDQNVINICNGAIITGIWHITHIGLTLMDLPLFSDYLS